MLTTQTTSHTTGTNVEPPLASLRGSILLAAALGIMLVLYGYSLVRTAWVCDDAYITFRTIENLLAGYGLTWNPDERVQAYTHPLWMLLLAAVRAVTGEIYYSSLFVSMALSLAAVLLVALGIARTWGQAFLAAAICTFSRAFVDFSTSGLENPLSYVLVAWFLVVFLRQGLEEPGTKRKGREKQRPPVSGKRKHPAAAQQQKQDASRRKTVSQRQESRHLLKLSLLASLIALNRMDLVLLVGPAMAHVFWQKRSAKGAGQIVLGFLPLVAWEMFSIIYYGFPFPNTAYAKLNTGIPGLDLARHGLDYLLDSLQADPLTLVAIGAALLAATIGRNWRHMALAAGIALYLLYVVRIGGDFMSGRFLTVALLPAMGVLVRLPATDPAARALCGGLLAACLGLAAPHPSLLTSNAYGLGWPFRPDLQPIADERAFYYAETGLLSDHMGMSSPTERFARTAERIRQSGYRVVGFATIGRIGYCMSPTVHVLDFCALADPLLARLPMKEDAKWRIGHFARHVPDGYLQLFQSEANRLSDPDLDAYYRKLRLILRGPLFSGQRWQAIWDMNLGRYDSLIDREFYRHPPERVWLGEVDGSPKPHNIQRNLPRDGNGAFLLPAAGFLVTLDDITHASKIAISVDRNSDYQVDYPQPGRFPVHQRIAADGTEPGQVIRHIDVPAEVASQGYDRLRIRAVSRGPHGLGFFRLMEGTTDRVTK
jgi:arabinofuranosyltransferase